MTLGQKIKKLRTDKGLTQKDLADQIHVTFQTISKWESDTNEPDIATIKELAKLFDCSLDYLLSDEEDKPKKEVVAQPVVAPTPVEVVTRNVVHQKGLHVCQRCNKDIPVDELHVEQLYRTERVGRSTRRVFAGESFYHKSCWSEICAQRQVERDKMMKEQLKSKKKIAFGWSIAAGVVGLIASLLIMLIGCREFIHPALSVVLSILIGYDLFAMVYCIVTGSYIAAVFLWCATRSIKFPGIIFSWSFEGFAWLIFIKVLFAILGFLAGLFFLAFAIVISSVLSIFSFPFVLIHNIKTKYEDSF